MFVKILVISFAISNVFALLLAQPDKGLLEAKTQWNSWEEWGKSLTSALLFTNPNFIPIRDWNIIEPEIEAKSASIFKINSIDPLLAENFELKEDILYQKNIDLVLPIASIAKLMTALIVLEKIDDLEKNAIVSEKAIKAYGNQGGLIINEKISVKNLLYALLMESSNDAAVALAEIIEEETGSNFIDLMNQKAKEIGLKKTFFVDASGYNPDNISTVEEIVKLVKYSFSQPIIWQALKTPEIDLSSNDGTTEHHWVNTDELLNRLPNIVGGKTGYTSEAQGCLVLVIEQNQRYLITIVLGAQERFLQTEKLIEWADKAYLW